MCSSLAGPDCCGGLDNIDFRQADLCVMNWLLGYVDPSDPYFVAAVLTIAFNPLFWNVASLEGWKRAGGPWSCGRGFAEAELRTSCDHLEGARRVARWEQKTRKLSRAFGSPYLACYALGGAIVLLNVLRSHCFTQAMLSQPRMHSLDNPTAYLVGLALLAVGGVLVLSSFFALGFTGTFLGDYFGILKEARVTTFPFNILDNPMYWGSTANYLGWAVMHASPAGLGLTAVVALVYVIAILYEEPFTAEIYRRKSSQLRKRS
uniref:Phosphatidylethanolamine N-methyltransferase n=1 Tax=Rhinolophus ferrumequinum TaxID=59479 RepID=A0A671EIT9_RHIFE